MSTYTEYRRCHNIIISKQYLKINFKSNGNFDFTEFYTEIGDELETSLDGCAYRNAKLTMKILENERDDATKECAVDVDEEIQNSCYLSIIVTLKSHFNSMKQVMRDTKCKSEVYSLILIRGYHGMLLPNEYLYNSLEKFATQTQVSDEDDQTKPLQGQPRRKKRTKNGGANKPKSNVIDFIQIIEDLDRMTQPCVKKRKENTIAMLKRERKTMAENLDKNPDMADRSVSESLDYIKNYFQVDETNVPQNKCKNSTYRRRIQQINKDLNQENPILIEALKRFRDADID